MKKSSVQFTTAQFARLHDVNKRTLHYYDNIGLFSPMRKGDNGYRYYDSSQNIDFEYIRMLKDLNMSIEELAAYLTCPGPEKFIKIAEEKENLINAQIQSLKRTKKILSQMKEQIKFCENLQEQEIRIMECREEQLLTLSYDSEDDNVTDIFSFIKNRWSVEQIRMGIGAFISLSKVINNDFSVYDGLFTPALKKTAQAESVMKPKGKYLCGYQKGTWDKLPLMYQRMISYADANHLRLSGYAYEMGLNEFVITAQEDYMTQIMIRIE